jgi:pyruvate/2-oxoglutarate dehydrogenase complex dihydrolipoamide acyltransferase (E2) component
MMYAALGHDLVDGFDAMRLLVRFPEQIEGPEELLLEG